MKLFFKEMGQGFPMVILHGLYGSSDNWLTIAKSLSAYYHVLIPDLRNHGRSPHQPEHSYEAMRDDIFELLDDNHITQCILLGHSMGGKVAMHVAATAPSRVSRLIIDDIAPINYVSLSSYSSLVAEHSKIMDALLQTDLSLYKNRNEIGQAWSKDIPSDIVRMFMLKNVEYDGTHYKWRINLQAIANYLPHILNGMDSLGFDKGHPIDIPTLFFKGAYSPYITEDVFPTIHRIFTHAKIVVIPEAGHWLHVEKPQVVVKELINEK